MALECYQVCSTATIPHYNAMLGSVKVLNVCNFFSLHRQEEGVSPVFSIGSIVKFPYHTALSEF